MILNGSCAMIWFRIVQIAADVVVEHVDAAHRGINATKEKASATARPSVGAVPFSGGLNFQRTKRRKSETI